MGEEGEGEDRESVSALLALFCPPFPGQENSPAAELRLPELSTSKPGKLEAQFKLYKLVS